MLSSAPDGVEIPEADPQSAFFKSKTEAAEERSMMLALIGEEKPLPDTQEIGGSALKQVCVCVCTILLITAIMHVLLSESK